MSSFQTPGNLRSVLCAVLYAIADLCDLPEIKEIKNGINDSSDDEAWAEQE